MKKITLLLMISTVFAKVLGFVREIILSYYFGASNVTDVYITSLTIPNTILAFIGIGIIIIYIPMYNKIVKEKGLKIADEFTSNLINLLFITSILIIFLAMIFTPTLVKLFASGFKGETLSLAINFTRITTLCMFFSVLIYLFKGYLNVKNSFLVPSLLIIIYNMFIIVSIILGAKYNLFILPLGFIIGEVLHSLLLALFVHQKGFKYSFVIKKNDNYIKESLTLLMPIIIGISINQINIIIDKTIASRIAVGGISALSYANKLNGFIQGIFVLSITTVMYPMISKMATHNNITGLKKTISEITSIISFLVLPSTVGAMLFSEEIVKFLFGRGSFDEYAIKMTSIALFYYSIGMIGLGLTEILSRVFYSLEDAKTPMINATISMGINIILNIILSRFMGIGGLALATSISAIISMFLMFITLRKKIGSLGIKKISMTFIKTLVASLMMGVLAKLSYVNLIRYISTNLSLIGSIGIGATVYVAIISLMKIEEVDTTLKIIKEKFGVK